MHRRIIHFDLDGVLADFRKGVTDNFGVSPESMTSDEMWTRIAAQPEFFLKLDVLKSGFELIELAKSLGEVRVLTALPRKATYALAEDEKRRWAARHLGCVDHIQDS